MKNPETKTACAKGYCVRYYGGVKIHTENRHGQSMYLNGYRYCRTCEVFLKPEQAGKGGYFCKCCRRMMRSKPGGSKRYKTKNGIWRDLREASRI